METVKLIIGKEKAAGLITFLKELDFVAVKGKKIKNNSANKKLVEIIIPATNPFADISGLFGAWKDSCITTDAIRNGSEIAAKLSW